MEPSCPISKSPEKLPDIFASDYKEFLHDRSSLTSAIEQMSELLPPPGATLITNVLLDADSAGPLEVIELQSRGYPVSIVGNAFGSNGQVMEDTVGLYSSPEHSSKLQELKRTLHKQPAVGLLIYEGLGIGGILFNPASPFSHPLPPFTDTRKDFSYEAYTAAHAANGYNPDVSELFSREEYEAYVEDGTIARAFLTAHLYHKLLTTGQGWDHPLSSVSADLYFRLRSEGVTPLTIQDEAKLMTEAFDKVLAAHPQLRP